MANSHFEFKEPIEASPETIFHLIADMPNYGRWLSGSDSFGATTNVSPYPVCLGTTYLDAGPLGERPGRVTAFDPPKEIGFHQTMGLKKGPLTGNADIRIHYSLTPAGTATLVIRTLDLALELAGFGKLAQPFVVSAFRKENARTLAELKHYVEAQRK